MEWDKKVVERGNDIVHLVQVNERIHLSNKSIFDIFSNIHAADVHYMDELRLYRSLNSLHKWNELRRYLVQRKPTGYMDVVRIMAMLDNRKHIWG